MPPKPQRVLNCTVAARLSPSTERDWASLGKQAVVHNDDLAQDKQRKPTCHSQHSRPLRYLQISRIIPPLFVCFFCYTVAPQAVAAQFIPRHQCMDPRPPCMAHGLPCMVLRLRLMATVRLIWRKEFLSKLRFVVVLICLFCGPHRKPHSSLWLNDTIPWSFTHSISRWSLGSNTTKYSRAKWRLRLQFWYFHPLPRGKFVLTVFSNYEGSYVSRLSGVLIFPPWRKKRCFLRQVTWFFSLSL